MQACESAGCGAILNTLIDTKWTPTNQWLCWRCKANAVVNRVIAPAGPSRIDTGDDIPGGGAS